MNKHCRAAFIKHELAGLYIPVKPIDDVVLGECIISFCWNVDAAECLSV